MPALPVRPTKAMGSPRLFRMPGPEELWMPVVDEPIGSLVAQIQEEDPELDALVSSPRRLLAFRTFAFIR